MPRHACAPISSQQALQAFGPTELKWGSDMSSAAVLWPGTPSPGGVSSRSHAPAGKSGSDEFVAWNGKMSTPAELCC